MVSQADGFYLERPLIFAHRGASDVAPENTMAAFRAALEAGADGVELDVTRCATGEIVVIHDDTVDRTTNGTGPVSAMPLFALRELDAGSWFSSQFAGERIPMLEEVLDWAVETKMRLNIEIKARNRKGDGIEEEVAGMIRRRNLESQVIVSSFNPLALKRTKQVAPELPCALLYAAGGPTLGKKPLARFFLQLEALHPHFAMVDEKFMRWAVRQGYKVNVWTVNEPTEMVRMIHLGVDGIITDHPSKLRQLLE